MKLADLRSYLKFLSKNKLYTVVTVLGFAVSLMFILLLSIYVKEEFSVDKFHKNKDRIYMLANSPEKANFSNPVADLIMDNIPEAESFTRLVSQPLIINNNQEKISVNTLYADSAFFNIFSFDLLEGSPSKVLALKNSVVVTKSFANKMFHDEDPIGKPLYLNDSLFLTVTGVMKDFPQNTIITKNEIVVNYRMIETNWGGDILNNWENSSFTHFYMAKEGADLPSKSQTILDLFLKNEYWLYKGGFADQVLFIPLEDVYFSEIQTNFSSVRNNSKVQVFVYMLITILILVVATLNYINLSVSQAGKRGKEAAIKKLLGSSRKSLVVQFICESMLMTFISFIIGLFLAFLAEPFFNDVLNTQLNLKTQFDLGFTLIVISGIAIIGLISGLVPAIVISHFQPLEVVKGSYIKRVKTTYSKILISFQYVVAISLLTCSFFIMKQTIFMKNYDLGFRNENILIMQNTLHSDRLPALRSLLETIPGVEKISFSAGTPVDGGNNNSFEYEGRPYSFQIFAVDTVFFDIFGIDITPTGVMPSEKTIWVNQVGYDQLEVDNVSHTTPMLKETQIAGITNDFHIRSLHEQVGPFMIRLRPDNWWAWSIIVKINSAEPFKTADAVKDAYFKFNGEKPFDSNFADQTIQKWYESEDRMVNILSAFTILTIIILLMGIFAMSQYYVQQKEKEIGIRKVNGATEMEVVRMLNMNFVRWIAIAFIVSLPIVYYIIQRWFDNFPYRTALSWWVFAITGIIVFVLSVTFISIQTWKAATANPVETLKNN